jgi:hypothetical protein
VGNNETTINEGHPQKNGIQKKDIQKQYQAWYLWYAKLKKEKRKILFMAPPTVELNAKI